MIFNQQKIVFSILVWRSRVLAQTWLLLYGKPNYFESIQLKLDICCGLISLTDIPSLSGALFTITHLTIASEKRDCIQNFNKLCISSLLNIAILTKRITNIYHQLQVLKWRIIKMLKTSVFNFRCTIRGVNAITPTNTVVVIMCRLVYSVYFLIIRLITPL